MATYTTAITSERWNDIVLLEASSAAAAAEADVADNFAMPAGLGDCALMEVLVRVFSIGTPIVDAVELARGIFMHVVSQSGAVVDIIGAERWFRTSATAFAAYLSPDPLVLIRMNEVVQVSFPEMDTGAAGTVVYRVNFKVVRVKPVDSPPGPIQLVR